MQRKSINARRFLTAFFCCVGLIMSNACAFNVKTSDTPPKESAYRVAYIPIDNRPVNQERVQYLAQSAGIELLMPKEDLYRTALDNMEPNSDGSTVGNREQLCEWLLEADKTCDHFIISLDQMTSGGLVGSRWLSNTDLSFEYGVIDTILGLCNDNTVYLFDTVMRLASTVGYQGYQIEEYNAFRAYGMAERSLLVENELTIERIIEGYPYAPNGELVATEVSETMLERYHAARARKLKIADYALRNGRDKVDFFYVGVDDSTPQNTIQTNEIQYIKSLMGDRGVLGAATDELGMCCLARMVSKFYVETPVEVTYFGDGANKPSDGFDIGTLEESIQTHLTALCAGEKQNGNNALQVLCLTRGCDETDRNALLLQAKDLQAKHIPAVIIDVSENSGDLGERLMKDTAVDVCRLFGYSCWNTSANAIGIALSQGVARYAYLQGVGSSTEKANEGFLKSIAFAYIKDLSYKRFHPAIDGLLAEQYPCSVSKVLERINAGRIVTGLTDFTVETHGEVEAFDFRYPWNRTFEMTFRMEIA